MSGDEKGLGRRRPKMAATLYKPEDPHVRPLHAPEVKAVAQSTTRVVGPSPRGRGTCPKCGQTVPRLAVHMRGCEG